MDLLSSGLSPPRPLPLHPCSKAPKATIFTPSAPGSHFGPTPSDNLLTSSDSADLRVDHMNSMTATKTAMMRPQMSTTKMPPMFSMPKPGGGATGQGCAHGAARGLWGARWMGWLTFSSMVLLLGAPASLPPLALQDLQPVVLLKLQDGQCDLIPERGAWTGQMREWTGCRGPRAQLLLLLLLCPQGLPCPPASLTLPATSLRLPQAKPPLHLPSPLSQSPPCGLPSPPAQSPLNTAARGSFGSSYRSRLLNLNSSLASWSSWNEVLALAHKIPHSLDSPPQGLQLPQQCSAPATLASWLVLISARHNPTLGPLPLPRMFLPSLHSGLCPRGASSEGLL